MGRLTIQRFDDNMRELYESISELTDVLSKYKFADWILFSGKYKKKIMRWHFVRFKASLVYVLFSYMRSWLIIHDKII